MQALTEFLIRHGYLVVFLWVLGVQAGLPLPAVPLLLAAGALAGQDLLNLNAVLGLSLVASLLSDAAWFVLGRYHGVRVLATLCRISLEPDSCVRRTERMFAGRGALSLLFAKFVPGLGTMAPPMAGLTRMPFGRFVLLDGIGALLWTAAFVLPGYMFSGEIERLADNAALTGGWLLGIFCAVVVLWIAVRALQRRAFLRGLRTARIEPVEVHRLRQDGEPLVIVDLRHAIDADADPYTLPDALRLDADEIERRHHEIPRDRDVVLFCT
ncbi:MAG: VTT domain-containing protein [Planctomycetes bacterium]|nr:VTT domain-containing protein [Planctomycetota bacterium]MCB9885977.1 VTT domain-containing protein [Planctomycetota bacterium]